MCGICGIYNTDGNIDKNLLKRMCNVIIHRGPDDEGYFLDKSIGLGVRRLSIIDVEGGHQPIHNEDESIWIVFNGEIYNFKELREELEERRHKFYTATDTETIVHAYEEFGEECVNKLNGMFAFAIWDSNKKRLLLARDRLGKKPLYYTSLRSTLMFASEIKSLLQYEGLKRKVNIESLHNYLTFSFVPSPYTMFDGIRKLLAGYILTCNKENSQIKQYWDIVFSESGILNEDYYKNKFLQLLKDSIRRRLISDVPFGAFLSGGTDSSLVVALMSEILENPVETFSVGYNEKEYSELRYARNIAEKYDTNHHELVIDADDVVNILPEFVWHEDEPSLMESSVAFFLLSKCAKKYVTVALCGEGSDELFAGYYSYLWEIYDRFDVFSKSIPKFLKDRFIPLIKNFRRLRYLPVEDTYFGSGTSFSEEQKQELYNDSTKDKVRGYSPHVTISKFKNRMTKLSDLNKMIYIDVKTWLPDCLLMNEDKMGMAASIESRIPFLDYRVVEFAATIPDKIKLKNGILKYVVKKVAYDYVPKENIDRAKMGFSTPVSFWFREDLFDIISQILLDKKTITRDYFNSNEIEKLLFDHKNKKFNNAHKIWQLLNMEIWHRIYIDNDDLSNPNLRLEKYM